MSFHVLVPSRELDREVEEGPWIKIEGLVEPETLFLGSPLEEVHVSCYPPQKTSSR